jgi:flagellar biosynthetic protein FliQ
MNELDVVAVLHASMTAALALCSPLLMAPLAAGLMIAIVQAITQINDSAVAYVPKLFATGAAAWFAGPFLSHTIADYMRFTFDKLVLVGGQ